MSSIADSATSAAPDEGWLEAADEEAALEMLHEMGCTDGLPVVVPTQARVARLVLASGLDAAMVLGEMGPAMAVENIASSLVTDYEVLAHERVCALANSADDRSKFQGFCVNYSEAPAVVVQIWHEHASAADSDVHPVEAKPKRRKRKAVQAPDSDVHLSLIHI